jgi:inner membrane protein
MDNICHTLVGAALAKTGLERRTALGGATLMIGANFPDIDVLAVPLGMSFEWRRGVTHGVLALVVLPVVLTGIMLAWDRLVRRRRGRDRPAADPRALVLLSAISILSHPVLDWMNVYGVRWLMPFDGTWFYGDALFIVDPWIWGALAVGVVAAGRRWRRGDSPSTARQPAAWALGVVSAYIVAMFALGVVAESRARRALAESGAGQADRIMAAPVPVNPLRRQIVASFNEGAEYRFADLRWTPATTFELQDFRLESGMGSPIARRARATERGAGFLQWARFPFVTLEGLRSDASVWIGDARYSVDARVSWAAVRIDLPADTLPIRE